MNLKKISLTILCISAFTYPSTMSAITARTAFSTGCTAAHWVFAVGAPILSLIGSWQDNAPLRDAHYKWDKTALKRVNAQGFDKVNVAVQSEKIKELIHKWDTHNALKGTQLFIKSGSDKVPFCVQSYFRYDDNFSKKATLYVHPEFANLISKRTIAKEENNQDQINQLNTQLLQFKPVLQHALFNIKSNLTTKKFLIELTSTLTTLGVHYLGSRYLNNSRSSSDVSRPTLTQDLLKVPIGILKANISAPLVLPPTILYSKYYTQKADDSIDNDISNLENMKTFFEKNGKKHLSKYGYQKPASFWLALKEEFAHPMQPRLTKRIEKIDQRIEKLKQQEQEQK